MAHLELADGVFIEYQAAEISGMNKCLNAQLDCTFDDLYQMIDAQELLEILGLDDNASLICHVNNEVFNRNF